MENKGIYNFNLERALREQKAKQELEEEINQRVEMNEECECLDCDGCDDEFEEIEGLVEEYSDAIMETDGCVNCIEKLLRGFLLEFIELHRG